MKINDEKTFVRIIDICGPVDATCFEKNVSSMRNAGIVVDYELCDFSSAARLTSKGIRSRLRQLNYGISANKYHYLLIARGGYGSSDLLDLIEWSELEKLKPRPLIGFSDASALQSAFYTRLGWPSLHASMPGSHLWGCESDSDLVIDFLGKRSKWSGKIDIESLNKPDNHNLSGKLFGGCLSVLSNLIGTPYFPRDLHGHIIFLEDTGETSRRLLRYFRQWMQSGYIQQAEAVILGRFSNIESESEDEKWFQKELASRLPCPLFKSGDFGHVQPNIPICTGAIATIREKALHWTLEDL